MYHLVLFYSHKSYSQNKLIFYTGLKTSCEFSLYNANRLRLVTEMECVYYAVQTKPVIRTQVNLILWKANSNQFHTEKGTKVGSSLPIF
jgi:hypothetical protein